MPTDMNGSLGAIAEVRLANGERRATIDPDDYSGGFATWSGTSFSAPVLAGQIAQFVQRLPSFDAVGVPDAVDRGWQALAELVPIPRPAP
jgi:subtilisin family serine protease